MSRTIKDELLQKLHESFGDTFRRGDNATIAIFPAKHPEVGDVEIVDDGDEATVHIGSITHGHFVAHMSEAEGDDRHREIADEVVQFLESFFDDRYLLWRGTNTGGWMNIDYFQSDDFSKSSAQLYFWSGPTDIDSAERKKGAGLFQ